MAISLPATAAQPLPQTPAQVEALALRAGQVVEARVVGAGTGETTQLAIGNRFIDAALAVRLQSGTLIQLLVQGSGPGARLTVLPQPSPGQGQQTAPAQQQAVPARQQARSETQTQPPPQAARTATQPVSVAAPASTPSKAVPQAHVQTQPGTTAQSVVQTNVTNARPALVPTPIVNAPAQAVSLQSPAGAVVPPAVSGPGQSHPLPASLEPGTVFRVQIQGTGANARPVLVPVANPNTSNPSRQAPLQNVLPIPLPNPLQQAVAQTVQNAVLRQDSIATLLVNLAGLGTKLADLPEPIARAGAELLAGRLNLSARPLDGVRLKQALAGSGVLFESTLQKSIGQPLPPGDLKSALLNFRNELRLWLGGDSQPQSQTRQPPPPPTPGALPRAGKPHRPPLTPNLSGKATGARLLAQSEAALARMQLTQISSLPESSMRVAQGPAGAAPEINIELPLMFGKEMSVGQFQISRDGGNGPGGKRDGEWKMRFSINFSQTGEVGATVSLRGGKTGVMLWAEREETAIALNENQSDLEDALAARGLEPGAIRCRHGSPPQAQKPVGAFMDNCS